jgi:N6-L-threonylcarbamoyladenine synthase
MLILGIESSCDETAASVVQDGTRVLSSIVSSQHDLHEEYAGVVPELASRAHVERIVPVIRESLAEAGIGLGMIDAVAVGNRPGLIGSLLVGVSAARALAWSLGKPLVGIDHVHAHLYSGLLHGPEEPPVPEAIRFPALGLVVSGGHTSIYRLDSWTRVTRLGGTIDDAIGEAYDKAATILGLSYPGGPNLDRLASSPGANPAAFDLPVSRLGPDSLDFSFSGLKTAVLYATRGVPGRREDYPPHVALDDVGRMNLAASFQKAAADAVLLKLKRALVQFQSSDSLALLTGGGVTANSRLRSELQRFAREQRLDLRLPARPYTVDNAAMIAGLAFQFIQSGHSSTLDLQAAPTTAC